MNNRMNREYNVLMKQTLHEMYKIEFDNFEDECMQDKFITFRTIILATTFNLNLLLNYGYDKGKHVEYI